MRLHGERVADPDARRDGRRQQRHADCAAANGGRYSAVGVDSTNSAGGFGSSTCASSRSRVALMVAGPALEIQAAHVIAIEEVAADRRRSFEHGDWFAAVEAAQVVAERARRFARRRAPRASPSTRSLSTTGSPAGRISSRNVLRSTPWRTSICAVSFMGGSGCYSERRARLAWRCAGIVAVGRARRSARSAAAWTRLFVDHAVLQRDRPIDVCGRATAGRRSHRDAGRRDRAARRPTRRAAGR